MVVQEEKRDMQVREIEVLNKQLSNMVQMASVKQLCSKHHMLAKKV